MTAENGEISRATTPAYRLIREAVAGSADEFTPEWMAEEFERIPSGSARLAVLQSMAIAALAIQRVAAIEGREPRAVLDDLWRLRVSQS